MRTLETKTEGMSSRSVKELLSVARVSLEEEDYGSSVFQFLDILKIFLVNYCVVLIVLAIAVSN